MKPKKTGKIAKRVPVTKARDLVVDNGSDGDPNTLPFPTIPIEEEGIAANALPEITNDTDDLDLSVAHQLPIEPGVIHSVYNEARKAVEELLKCELVLVNNKDFGALASLKGPICELVELVEKCEDWTL